MFQQEELYLQEQGLYQLCQKYVNRKDISIEQRLHIACTVLCFNSYGSVTKLAKKYDVSRQFIYNLRDQLLIGGWLAFGFLNQQITREETKEDLDLAKEILSLRLEGKSPILGISQLLKRKGYKKSSIGYISELLTKTGKALGQNLEFAQGVQYAVVFASDEVFSKSRPILITVDPVSSLILRIDLSPNRSYESWKDHWQNLLDIGITPLYIVSDEGKGMKAAKKKLFADLVHQTDSFHAISHRLWKVMQALEKQTYGAIGEEYSCTQAYEKALEKGKGKENVFIDYYSSMAKAADYIDLYEQFSFWYAMMRDALDTFDKNGEVVKQSQALQQLIESIEQINELNWFFKTKNEEIAKIMKTIEGLTPNLFHFLQQAEQVVKPFKEEAKTPYERQALQAFCRAYQYRKNAMKVKHSPSQKYYKEKENEALICAEILLEESAINFDYWHQQIYAQLDRIVQSSAMVETINSIVRSYLNLSKNQVTQEQLNLIMFYHNHRKYVQGKRKGYSPIELFTGQKQEDDWLDLMIAKSSQYNLSEAVKSLDVGKKVNNIAT